MIIVYRDKIGYVTQSGVEDFAFCNGKVFFSVGEKDYTVKVSDVCLIKEEE